LEDLSQSLFDSFASGCLGFALLRLRVLDGNLFRKSPFVPFALQAQSPPVNRLMDPTIRLRFDVA
jgi:hypothetical protein